MNIVWKWPQSALKSAAPLSAEQSSSKRHQHASPRSPEEMSSHLPIITSTFRARGESLVKDFRKLRYEENKRADDSGLRGVKYDVTGEVDRIRSR